MNREQRQRQLDSLQMKFLLAVVFFLPWDIPLGVDQRQIHHAEVWESRFHCRTFRLVRRRLDIHNRGDRVARGAETDGGRGRGGGRMLWLLALRGCTG